MVNKDFEPIEDKNPAILKYFENLVNSISNFNENKPIDINFIKSDLPLITVNEFAKFIGDNLQSETYTTNVVSIDKIIILLFGNGFYKISSMISEYGSFSELTELNIGDTFLGMEVISDNVNSTFGIIIDIDNPDRVYIKITSENDRWSLWEEWTTNRTFPVDLEVVKTILTSLNAVTNN